MKQQII